MTEVQERAANGGLQQPPRTRKGKTIFGANPLKVLFAGEYVLQGLANPFQGMTYQSFFRHLRSNYGLSEAATQSLFSRSYLAWSFKPVIGFFMDAYGKTKVILTILLLAGASFYLLTPLFDVSAMVFFWMMFGLSVVFACTDVAVDRATVIAGDEESKASGKSKAATVGLNQAICWAAIYGTSIVAYASGGWIADNIEIKYLLIALAAVPLLVFTVVTRLPKDVASPIPIRQSVSNFWEGWNTGPIVWIVLFYFLFHFQPALGALWTNYLIETLEFTQTQIGFADGVAYSGYFLGVVLFAWLGIKWQDRFGLKNVFKIFIVLSILVNLTQYVLVDPWFSQFTTWVHTNLFPGANLGAVRWGYYAAYYFMSSILISFIRMSTFSLVGAVIPVSAAGSLFAGFMSVANLAYSFSYASGSWLYDNGMNLGIFRTLQNSLFGIPGGPGDKMSIALLIFIGSMAYLSSFIAVHFLPDQKQTRAAEESDDYMIGPEHFKALGERALKRVNITSLVLGVGLFYVVMFKAGIDFIGAVLLSFFIVTFFRKLFLNWRYNRHARKHA
jgi:MFS family permease